MENAVIVRPDLAGPETVAKPFQGLEDEDAYNCRRSCGANCRIALWSPKKEEHDPESIPDPAIPHPCRDDHPDAKPSRGAPAIHPPHQPLIAAFDVSPEAACNRHRVTSTCPLGLESRIHVPEHPAALFAALQQRGPFFAETNFVDPVIYRESRNHEIRFCKKWSALLE